MASSRNASPEDTRERVGRWLLATALLGTVLALGGVHTEVLAASCSLATTAMVLLWWKAVALRPRPAATLLVCVAATLLVWTTLQIVPLPSGVLESIAPANADVWERSLTALRQPGPRLAPISLDPTATRVQLLRGLTYLSTFLAALRLAQRPAGVLFLERAIVVSAGTLAVAAFLHPAVGASTVFGLYAPKELHAYDPHHIAPLLNTNHLAAYANIGCVVALASAFEAREAVPRPIAIVVVLGLAATTVWTASRGGSATLVVGAVLVAVIAFRRRTDRSRLSPQLVVATLAVAGASLFLFSLFDDTRTKFAGNNLFKLDLIRNACELLRGHAFFGIGRGAFESTFPSVREGDEDWMYTHPENIVAQWLIEWGFVGLVAFGAIVWALRPRTLVVRSRPPAGPWAALVTVGLQNLVDYSSEIPAVVMALCVCAAIVTGGVGGTSPAVTNVWARYPRRVAIAVAAAAALAIGITLPFTPRELYEEERSLRDAALDRELPVVGFHERARAAMLHHPAEPYLPFLGAVRAAAARDESVLPWAARALERSRVYGRVHLLLAQTFFRTNPAQARLEYRLACSQDSRLCKLDEALPLIRTFDDALEIVPDGSRGSGVLASLSTALASRLPSTTVRLDEELVRRDPTALQPARHAAAAAMKDVRGDEPWCEGLESRRECIQDGFAAAQMLISRSPDHCEGYAARAELMMLDGDPNRAVVELDEIIDLVTDRSECLRTLVQLTARTDNSVRAEAAINRLVNLSCTIPKECVDNLLFAARTEQGRGNHRRAIAILQRAVERDPEREDVLIDLARAGESQGLHSEAMDAYAKLAQRHPENKAWAAALAREREATERGLLLAPRPP